jgi:GLUG motif-containing protein
LYLNPLGRSIKKRKLLLPRKRILDGTNTGAIMAAIGLRICLSFAIGCASLLAAAGAAQAAVEISSKPTKNMSCSAGVCSPTARKAWLNEVDLVNLLANSDVRVTTGAGATVIEVAAAFSWVSPTTLTLDSERSIIVKREVTVAGSGGLTLTTNDSANTDGVLSFQNKGRATFWDLKSDLVVNGTKYALVNDILTLGLDVRGKNRHPTYLALARDYDAAADGVYRGSPVQKELVGTFEGLGHTILNLAVNQATQGCVGLFAQLGPGATIRDINLSSANVSTTFAGNSIGALVGCNMDGNVVGSSAAGVVSGFDRYVGGLVGENRGRVIDSSASVSVSGNHCAAVGGLVGRGGYILRSHASGSVSAQGPCLSLFAGGLVGQFASIDRSFATGNVTIGDARHSFAGGLIGFNRARTIANAYATGLVEGDGARLGGFAGKFYLGIQVIASYSIGVVTGRGRFGGFVAKTGLAGGEFTNVYWDIDTSGQKRACARGNCSGIVGLSDAQMKSGLPDGFDPTIWGQDATINGGYPYLLADPPPK